MNRKEIGNAFEHAKQQLGLKDYRIIKLFEPDKKLKGFYAVVIFNHKRKVIYLKLNETNCLGLSKRGLKELALHEMCHGFFTELNDLFCDVMRACRKTGKEADELNRKFLVVEHRQIHKLVKAFMKGGEK